MWGQSIAARGSVECSTPATVKLHDWSLEFLDITRCPSRDNFPIFRTSGAGSSWSRGLGAVFAAGSPKAKRTVSIPELSTLRWKSRRRGADLRWRILRQAAGPGWFAMGDAAAVCDPAAAQGVLLAISSGLMVGHLLSNVIDGGITESQTARYYDDWLRNWFRSTIESFRTSHDPFYRLMDPSPLTLPIISVRRRFQRFSALRGEYDTSGH
jgi:hypothetical protein